MQLSRTIFTVLFCVFVSFAAQGQTDVTSQYITNPNFDDGTLVNQAPRGWTLTLETSGVQSKISTAAKADGLISDNQNHWQLWKASGTVTGQAFQKLTDLPAGRYRFSATVVATFTGSIELYMNGATTAVVAGQAKVYEVDAVVTSGHAEVGLNINSTNGVLIDFDSFRLLQSPLSDDDLSQQLADLHTQCVADTLARNRQKWYNREAFLTAFTAYDEAIIDDTKVTQAIALLQAAHEQYEVITEAYTTLRTEAIELYKETNKSKFALRDSVKQIRANIISYYNKNENHYTWVMEALPSLRTIKDLFGWYKRMSKVTSVARNQLTATAYDGLDTFKAVLSEAWAMQTSATTKEAFEQGIAFIKQAQAAYLATRPSEWVTIQNGKLWKTTTGATVQAHAPGFVRVGDIWYMVGEDRTKQWNPDVNLYSSTDLVKWKFEKKIIENGITTKELGSSRMIERPKLMYNARTDKFVVWCHYEAGNYGASEAAWFECDSVNGAYEYVWSGRPLGIKSRDCNVFQEADGTAYFISTTEENRHLGLFRLSDDYHEAVEHTQLFSWQSREAPAIVRMPEGRYFMLSSACSGWDPNQCKLSYTQNIKSGWSSLANIGNPIAFDTQAAAILVVKGTKQTTYLYVGDRWQDPGLPESKTIIFPISFNGTTCEFKYHERFDINFVTGEWRETPTDDLFAEKAGWKIVDCSSQETSSENSPARNAIDGNVNTKWHTKYSGTTATAPHHITIDLSRERIVKGFLATPRMDGSTNGLIRKYTFEVSTDGQTWTTASSGNWLPYCTEVTFARRTARYFRLTATEGTYASLAEIDILIDKDRETGIENVVVADDETVNRKSSNGKCYDLSGREVAKDSSALSRLPRGIYIVGGCKVVLK